jgi:uncharacterized protein (TIGR02172 family)
MLQTLIGRGLTSEVYAWGDGLVLKLFPPWRAVSDVEREYAIARAVHAAGLPVPAVHRIVEHEGRLGVVFEHVEGPSMLKYVEKRPWTLFRAARQLAELHAQLHRRPAPPELPSQRRQLESWIDAATGHSESARQAAKLGLQRLPDGEALCHGDFHPQNILLTARGPMIIDWSSGSRGHPLADVGFTSLLFRKANLPADTSGPLRPLFTVSRGLLHHAYLSRYLRLRPGTRRQIEAWIPVLDVAVAPWRLKGITQLHQPGGVPL